MQFKVFLNLRGLEFVICAAAKVGGILANNNFPVDFLHNNLLLSKVMFCFQRINIKLRNCYLWDQHVFIPNLHYNLSRRFFNERIFRATNEPYALAKIAGIKLCECYYRQYGDNFFSVMPNNLYGPNDNFDPATSHVIPALIKKFHYAKIKSLKSVEIWGSGKPIREFLHVQDLSEAVLFIMDNVNAKDVYSMGITHINIGLWRGNFIKDIALLIKNIIGFKGRKYPLMFLNLMELLENY